QERLVLPRSIWPRGEVAMAGDVRRARLPNPGATWPSRPPLPVELTDIRPRRRQKHRRFEGPDLRSNALNCRPQALKGFGSDLLRPLHSQHRGRRYAIRILYQLQTQRIEMHGDHCLDAGVISRGVAHELELVNRSATSFEEQILGHIGVGVLITALVGVQDQALDLPARIRLID